nr:SLC13 family permease [Kocuria sp. 2SI]
MSWPQWFAAGAPWAAVMSVVLYFVMRATIKPEIDRLEGGREIVQKSLTELGPMTGAEKRLAAVAVILLAFWSTQGSLHDIDATTVTLCAIGVMLLPRIGVYSWETVEELVSWGTLVVFAVGISLGSVLLETGAAAWQSAAVFDGLGITGLPVLAIIAIVGAFTILIHLGFASATSMSSALIPVFIALAVSIPDLPGEGVGFVLIMQFLICFGFLLPISAPQNMLAYGTGALTTQLFLRTGIPPTIAGYLRILLFSATYWQWIGLL